MIISGTMVTINASKPNTKAKSAPVHQVLYFEGPQLVDNSYCQARVQVQGLSQISNKRPGPGA